MSNNLYADLMANVEEQKKDEEELKETEIEEVEQEETWENKYEVKEEATTTHPIAEEVKVNKKENKGGHKVSHLLFEGDNFLVEGLDVGLYVNEEDTLSIPLNQKDLYSIKVDVENVEHAINDAFKENSKRVSFSLEELGLHNRLVEMGAIPQDFQEFVIVKTEKGNVAVSKTRISMTDVEKQFMHQAEECLSKGQRIVIPLLENYNFTDEYDISLERSRFRASLGDIKNFIARTHMKGTITKDAFLILNE